MESNGFILSYKKKVTTDRIKAMIEMKTKILYFMCIILSYLV